MAIAYKGFTAYLADKITRENVSLLGRFEYTIVTENTTIPTGRTNKDTLITEIDANNDYRNQIIGATYGTIATDYQRLLYVLPGIVSFGVGSYSDISPYGIKYVAANGSYAFGRNVLTSSLSLYDANDNIIGGFDFNATASETGSGYAAIANFDGTFQAGQTGHSYHIIPYDANNLNVSLANFTISQAVADWFNAVTPLVPPDTDPYANLPLDGEEEITGGGSGTVSIPGFPGLSATSTGIIGLFAPSASQMQALASFMWTDFGGQGTTTEAILSEIVEALKRSISNPLDYVVGLNIIPSQGLSIGATQTIQFGFVSSNVSMPALSSQYFTVDCGSITFDPLCGNTFLDYAPYSKFSIYLPYIGVKDLDANDCVGHTIGVVYHGDTVTGGVTAYITKDQSVMYQYSGCCALNVPLSSDNWGSTIAGAVQIATSMVSGGLTAGAAGVGAAAAQGAANVAANPSLLSPQVQHSGAVSGGAGCMGVQYPFIIREAVRFHSTAGFNKIAGYPSFYKRKLENVSGYTTVVDVHLDNVPATKPELEEIIELLKGGVYL